MVMKEMESTGRSGALGAVAEQMRSSQISQDIHTFPRNTVFREVNPQLIENMEKEKGTKSNLMSTQNMGIGTAKAGAESGITAEFVTRQAAVHLAPRLDELFNYFDLYQASLYGTEGGLGQEGAPPKVSAPDKVIYEESILMTLLGEGYQDFIDAQSGEWESEHLVLGRFQQVFLDNIMRLFRT